MTQQNTAAEPSGIIVLNKPTGITSHDAVNRLRRLYGTKRVGHTGTLDPLANGVLVMLVGRAAKAAEYISCASKSYVAVMKLGITTDTEDITGAVLTEYTGMLPSANEVTVAAASFKGDSLQVPPMYSALKVGGKKLCDLARSGATVERQPRKISICSISAETTSLPTDYILRVTCSAGTYIRTLCADIGERLGCGGTMAALTRSAAGCFSLDDALTLELLEEMTYEERVNRLLPVESLFSEYEAARLSDFYYRLCVNGCEIYQSKIGTKYAVGERLRLLSPQGSFFALGEIREYPNGTAIKTIKMF